MAGAITVRLLFGAFSLFCGSVAFSIAAAQGLPETVRFAGPDGIALVGYLFRSAGDAANERRPAIVMMHGRAGAYSTRAEGTFDASTLSQRHRLWGRRWAAKGYVVLLVDSFGPRGFPAGFPIHSYADRPEAVNEVTVRPRDAYAALAYLRSRTDIDPARIALQGWSNGGSATLATMATPPTADGTSTPSRFVGAIAFYPACGLHDRFATGYRPYAPVRVFSGDADEEVSYRRCRDFVDRSREGGGDIAITIFAGATHDFDDPGSRRQSLEANVIAGDAAWNAAAAFMREWFGR